MVCFNGKSFRIIYWKLIFRFYYWYIVKLDLFWLKNFIWFVFVFKKILLKVRFMWIKYRFSNIFYVIINKSILKKFRINYLWNIICFWYGVKLFFLVFDLILYSIMNLLKNWFGVFLINKVIMNKFFFLYFWINVWNFL